MQTSDLPERRAETLSGYAMLFSFTLEPLAGHYEQVIQLCASLVEHARESRDCLAAMYGMPAGDDSRVACHFLFGADGPFSRFTSIRSTSKPYRDFRKRVEPLLAELPKVAISYDLAGFVSVKK